MKKMLTIFMNKFIIIIHYLLISSFMRDYFEKQKKQNKNKKKADRNF